MAWVNGICYVAGLGNLVQHLVGDCTLQENHSPCNLT
jgi:hypothetical protein